MIRDLIFVLSRRLRDDRTYIARSVRDVLERIQINSVLLEVTTLRLQRVEVLNEVGPEYSPGPTWEGRLSTLLIAPSNSLRARAASAPTLFSREPLPIAAKRELPRKSISQ